MIIDSIFSYLASAVKRKTIPNVINPQCLTDKILRIKISPHHQKSSLRSLVADRNAVRKYIESQSSDCSLVPLLWSGEEFTQRDYDKLPTKFVIKANHGSKMVRIVDKNNVSDAYLSVSEEVNNWKYVDYYKKGREWVYKDTPKTLLVEKFIEFNQGVPPDFKFFCLNGKVAFVQVDLDRFNGHCRNIYDTCFNRLPVNYQFEAGYEIEKPLLFDKSIKVAEQLARDFDFIRVDLYVLEQIIYFGELTNFPGNCLEKFSPHSFDTEMGQKLHLDEYR